MTRTRLVQDRPRVARRRPGTAAECHDRKAKELARLWMSLPPGDFLLIAHIVDRLLARRGHTIDPVIYRLAHNRTNQR